ncbi:MAG: hypothetical protein WKF43_02350 [Acidimicrobiales bacterium]
MVEALDPIAGLERLNREPLDPTAVGATGRKAGVEQIQDPPGGVGMGDQDVVDVRIGIAGST